MNVFQKMFLGKLANYLTAVVSALLLLVHVADVNMQSPPIDLSGYTLAFADEFDGEALNDAVWRVHNFAGVRKGGYWSASQASVADGCLRIRTQYLDDGEFGGGWYTCGLSTQGNFKHAYGYYECRCILPYGQGLWSAFWLTNPSVGAVTGTAENGAELDIFESPYSYLKGEKAYKVTSNIHYNGYNLQTKYKNVVISALDNDPYENFNTYGLLWTPDEYIFYVNGREVGRSRYGGVSQQPEYLILSCEVDGAAAVPTYGWSGNIEKNGRSFSADFVVDYVYVWDAAS